MVGEGGPEMFVPSQSGRIEPNGSSGGGVSMPKPLPQAVAQGLWRRITFERWMGVSSDGSRCVTSRSQWRSLAVGGDLCLCGRGDPTDRNRLDPDHSPCR